jgi:hypothetical protein
MATRSPKTKQQENKQKPENSDTLTVETLKQPETEGNKAFWKSYKLYFAAGESTGNLHGFLIVSSDVPLDNINGVTLSGCNVKAMDLRASEDIVNKNHVDHDPSGISDE